MTMTGMTEARTAPNSVADSVQHLQSSLDACHGKLNTIQSQMADLQASVSLLTEKMAAVQIDARSSQSQLDAMMAKLTGAPQ
jgi:peptidoglycan hydrolase CwlO-like protein